MFENYTPVTLEELQNSPGLHNCVDYAFDVEEDLDAKITKAKRFVLKSIKKKEFREKHEIRKINKYAYKCIKCDDGIVKLNRNWIKLAKQAKQHTPTILTCRRCHHYIQSKYMNSF